MLASATDWMDELKSIDGLTRVLSERGAQLVVFAFLIALALDCALILTRALSHDSTPPAPSSSAPAAAFRPNVNPTLQLATILNGHLFGVAGVSSSASNAPPTTMALILAGVIAQKDPNAGQAIIGESASAGKLYAVGGAIPGGARLHAVYSDRVLLERNGALEALMLPHTPMAGVVSAAVGPPRTSALRDNTSTLAGLVSMQPVFVQNKLTGYRIFPGNGARGANTFSQLGLKAGDLVVAINGTALDDASRALEVMQTLSSAATATVTVSRNGQVQEVNLNLASLNLDTEGAEAPAGAQSETAAPGPAARRRVGPAPVGIGNAAGGGAGTATGTATGTGDPNAGADAAATTNNGVER